MISIPDIILKSTCHQHTRNIVDILRTKTEVLRLCLNYYDLKKHNDPSHLFNELKTIKGDHSIKKLSINWLLKSVPRKDPKKNISSLGDLTNYFKNSNRVFLYDKSRVDILNRVLGYFSLRIIKNIISGLPKEIQKQQEDFDLFVKRSIPAGTEKEIESLVEYLFDYNRFKNKKSYYSKFWDAYKLTASLTVRSCLYCNRNYIITVARNSTKTIRPEIDHFFPQFENKILALSFYNLIPSCHTCNSNLKGGKSFDLGKYFHPYLGCFDEQSVRFIYKPKTPLGFFSADKQLQVKLDQRLVTRLNRQIEANISLFKLNEIYNEHVDIVNEFIMLKRKTNKRALKSIITNVLVDRKGRPIILTEKELYQLIIRNYYEPNEYYKKPMAKFEKDIATELKLI